MFFRSLSPTMLDCATLCAQATDVHNAPWTTYCAHGLELLVQDADIYDVHVKSSENFLTHFAEELESLRQTCQKLSADDTAKLSEAVCDATFSLLEDIVLFIREKTLRTGFSGITRMEENIIHFFESGGYWQAGDGSLVADMYYVKLPANVLHEMLGRLETMHIRPDTSDASTS